MLAPLIWVTALAITAPVTAPAGMQRPGGHRAAGIEWDASTLSLIQPGAGYGRMIRLVNRDILCCYGRQGKAWVRRSRDDGRSWDPAVLAASYEFGAAANPEMLLLQNGWILLAYNERPNDGVHPFTIMTCRSKDNGASWTGHRLVRSSTTQSGPCN